MYTTLLPVMLGGAIGCAARWLVSLRMNALWPNLPLGTLIVNLVGGLIIGAAMACFTRYPNLDPGLRLFVMTGLCGGLTTFSTFSLEVMTLLQSGRLAWAATTVTVHVAGSLVMTFAGFALVNRLVS